MIGTEWSVPFLMHQIASQVMASVNRHARTYGLKFEGVRVLYRLMAKDGTFYVRRDARPSGLSEGFVALATMPPGRLVGTIVATYLTMNLFFGSCYMAIGVDAKSLSRRRITTEDPADRGSTASAGRPSCSRESRGPACNDRPAV